MIRDILACAAAEDVVLTLHPDGRVRFRGGPFPELFAPGVVGNVVRLLPSGEYRFGADRLWHWTPASPGGPAVSEQCGPDEGRAPTASESQ